MTLVKRVWHGGNRKAGLALAGLLALGLAAASGTALAATGSSAALTRPALVVAVIAAAVLWGAGEQFGGLLTGQATGPNSGPLLVLLALAFWPRRTSGSRGPEESSIRSADVL